MSKIFKKNDYKLLIIGTIIVTIVMQLFFVPNLPEKYFYDSQGIMNVANGTYNHAYFDGSYVFAGEFYRSINILNFSTFAQWAFAISAISSIIIVLFLNKYHKSNFLGVLFIYLIIALANIYLFRISKDFIQLLFFALCYLVIKRNERCSLISVAILILEGLVFRTYYIGIAIIALSIYELIKKAPNKKTIKRKMILFASALLVMLIILNIVYPSGFNYIANIRTNINQGRELSPDAVTMINNIIPGNSVLSFIGNYIVNLGRILFPVELVMKGIIYIPFIAYQLIFVYFLLTKSREILIKKEREHYMSLAIIVAYLLISSIFEPDFGSVVRHEITMFPLFMPIFLNGEKVHKKNSRHFHIKEKYGERRNEGSQL